MTRDKQTRARNKARCLTIMMMTYALQLIITLMMIIIIIVCSARASAATLCASHPSTTMTALDSPVVAQVSCVGRRMKRARL